MRFGLSLRSVILVLISTECVIFNPTSVKLGIDYGLRLIGIAVSDRFSNVYPVSTITNTHNLTEVSTEIANIVQNKGALDVILGIPLDSNGKLNYEVRNFNGGLCLQFSQVLASVLKHKLPRVTVYLVDERFSTREAKARLKYEKIKASLDALSAACLIERFIEDQGEYSIEAKSCGYPPPPDMELLDYSTVSDYVRESREQALSPTDLSRRRMAALKSGKRTDHFEY